MLTNIVLDGEDHHFIICRCLKHNTQNMSCNRYILLFQNFLQYCLITKHTNHRDLVECDVHQIDKSKLFLIQTSDYSY